jgi:SM-20-related protein
VILLDNPLLSPQLTMQLTMQLTTQGYAVVDDALPLALVQQLRAAAETELALNGQLAGIGRAADYTVKATVRSDKISWLTTFHPVSADYLRAMEQFRLALNQQLLLGLFRYEAHYASYAPGAYYHQHRDAFKGSRNRLLSTVLYLNDGWQAEDGGELVLYANDAQTPLFRCLPVFNRLAVFLSEEFPHEVLVGNKQRYSIAGWFRAA